jgi:hypothetical protein
VLETTTWDITVRLKEIIYWPDFMIRRRKKDRIIPQVWKTAIILIKILRKVTGKINALKKRESDAQYILQNIL